MSTARLQPAPLQIVDDRLLEEIVAKIVQRFQPRRIILFGSRARGDARADSDVDLFVEMETNSPPFQRRAQIRALFPERRWSLELLVYTPEEVAERRRSLVSIVPVVEQEGRVLYERTSG